MDHVFLLLLTLHNRSIELRKIKRLGQPNQFRVVKPGDFASGLFKKPLSLETLQPGEEDDDLNEEEQLPKQNLPPFEPLVLWNDPNDPENKIEVRLQSPAVFKLDIIDSCVGYS